MLVELLIVTACLQDKGGCSESTSAYTKYNVEVAKTIENVERYGQRLVNSNEWVVYAATPFLAAVSGKTANFKIYKGLVLGVNVKQENVLLQWSY